MKTITIGDPHGRDQWKEIIAKAGEFDKVVFIGDYFDSYDLSAKVQMKNFKEIIAYKKKFPNKVVLLYGNHDLHYLIAGEQYSGYQLRYQYMIETLLRDAQDLLQVAFEADGVLYTHAGVTKTWAADHNIGTVYVSQRLNDTYLGEYSFSREGDCDRGGNDIFQSPMWVRPDSLSVDLIDDYDQVVGHSERNRIEIMEGGRITIIDSPNSYEYLEVTDGTKKIIKFKYDIYAV